MLYLSFLIFNEILLILVKKLEMFLLVLLLSAQSTEAGGSIQKYR